MKRVSAVLFDFGGVLTSSIAESFAAWIAENDIDGPKAALAITRLLAQPGDGTPGNVLHGLETGTRSVSEFEVELAGQLRHSDGRPVDPAGMLDGMFAQVRLDESMWTIVDELRARDIVVTVLSNSWGDRYPHERMAGTFDDLVISERVGQRKPDPAIYALAAERIGIPVQECVFIDDLDLNVEAARRVGMDGILHTDAATTRAALRQLGLRLPEGTELDGP